MSPLGTPSSIIGLLLAGLPLAAHAQQATPPTPVDPSLNAYANPKDSVRLPDGRTFHIVCMGKGSPTVILSPGSSGWSENWHLVQPAVAAKTRVCAWDRAGQGLSTGLPQIQDVTQATSDLQVALKTIPGPYIAVGVSLGGLDSLVLADREPSQVKGMVLVDPSFPDQNKRLDRAAAAGPAAAPGTADRPPPPFILRLMKCMDALRAGTVRPGGPDPDGCLVQQYPADYPPALRAALDQARAAATPQQIAASLEGIHSEPSVTLTIKPDRNYAAMPLIVLTAGINDGGLGPDAPAETKARVARVAAEWRRANQELATLSTRGVWRLVPDSSHDIPSLKPQVVIDAIDDVVDAARAAAR